MKLFALTLFVICFSYIKHTSDQSQYYFFNETIYRITFNKVNVQNFSSNFQYLIVASQNTFSYKNYYYSLLDAFNIPNFEILDVIAAPQYGEIIYIIDTQRTLCPGKKIIYADASKRQLRCSDEQSSFGKDVSINIRAAHENFDITFFCKNESPKCFPSRILYTKSKLITEAINCDAVKKDTKPLLFEIYLSSQYLHSYYLKKIQSCYKSDNLFTEKLNRIIDFKLKQQTYR